MNEILSQKAQELGRLLGQSQEYQAVTRAQQRLTDDREAVAAMNRLNELENEVTTSLQNGLEPSDAVKGEYERVFSALQSSPAYQEYVAAQSNFDKQLVRVNEEISRGIESGSRSRIILPS
jgi:cell fate (sporulation/competence/biofilm development) regulator YlbF (YheA/YmcA/DUF963 family)